MLWPRQVYISAEPWFDDKRALEEAALLSSLPNHPCVLHYIAAFTEETFNASSDGSETIALHIVTELASGGTLWDRISSIYHGDGHDGDMQLFDRDTNNCRCEDEPRGVTTQKFNEGASASVDARHAQGSKCDAHGRLVRNVLGMRACKRFDDKQLWRWVCQIALGVEHLHANSILHRDLKSSNILLTERDDAVIG